MKKQLYNSSCITVAELKKHIADWPETDADGTPTEVWLESGRGSSPCSSVEILNSNDLLFGFRFAGELADPQ